ncbi:MAG: DNA polymerase III subunit gamma and tau, partial [Corynebacterium sp.]|nr:DNA polymerase III subunit gamma and tau [Corynebacterium sp.]
PAGIEQIRERWQDILAAVDGPHAFPIRVLAEQAVPLDVENDTLIIGHSTGALATRLNTPDYEQALSAAVKQVTGFNGQVHCVVGTRPRAPRSTATGGVAGEDDSSSRGSSSPNDTAPAPTPAASAQPKAPEPEKPTQPEPQAQPEPAPRPQRSSAYASVAERRAKIEAAKRAAMGHQAGHDQPAQPHQQSQPSQPTQPNPNPVHQQPQQQPNQPQPQSFLRAAQVNAQANAQAQANQDSGFGGVPLPPEPMEEFAPPEGAEGAGGYGSRTPSNANTTYNPVSQNLQDNNYEEDTSEYFEAANEVGSLDHRSLKDVVMEMLEKELGAKPLEDR